MRGVFSLLLVAFIVMKVADVAPVASWPWWQVLWPLWVYLILLFVYVLTKVPK